MNIIILVCIMFFSAFTANGQSFVDVSKTKKITKEGVEITTFEGQPFTGYLTETYPKGKQKTWKTVKDGITNGQWQIGRAHV